MKENYKTNATRILETKKINFTVNHYSDDSENFSDGVSVAEMLGEPVEKVFKTLVTKGSDSNHYVFVIPVAKELDLKAAARSVGVKSVEMIKVSEINKVTGYIRGGCTPIGMKKNYKTVIDKSALNQESIYISAGKIGFQLCLSPLDLQAVTGCNFEEITF